MRRAAARLLPLVLPLLLLGAKGSKSTPQPDAAPPATSSEMAQQVLASMSLDASMKLLDAGAEPRRAVRFTPSPGSVTTLEMTQEMSASMVMNGMSMPVPSSGMVTTTRTSVGQPDATGAVHVTTEVVGTRTTGAPQGPAPSLTGLTTDILVGSDGRIADVQVRSAQDDAAAAMAQQFAAQTARQLQAFPAEAIGVGAAWETQIDMGVAGLSLVAVSTSRVRTIGDDAIDLDVTVEMRPGSSAFAFPGLPPGASMELTRFAGAASGTQHVDLDRMVTSFTQDTTVDMDLKVTMPQGGPPGGMTMGMQMAMKMSAAPVATP